MMNAEGARMIASPVWRATTRSKAGMLPVEKFPEKCFETWAHQDGLENLCMIATPQRSSKTGGTHVGSTNGEHLRPSQQKVSFTLRADDYAHSSVTEFPSHCHQRIDKRSAFGKVLRVIMSIDANQEYGRRSANLVGLINNQDFTGVNCGILKKPSDDFE